MKILQTIIIVVACTLASGCKVAESALKALLKDHRNPPERLCQELSFQPVPMSTSTVMTYTPHKCFKIDKRTHAVRANVVVRSSQDAMTAQQAITILAGTKFSILIQDSAGSTIFTNLSELSSLQHQVRREKPLIISFEFPEGPFSAEGEQLDSVEFRISVVDDVKGADRLSGYLEFIRIEKSEHAPQIN